MAGNYWFRNYCRWRKPPVYDVDGRLLYHAKGLINTHINYKVKGGLRWNEWHAIKLKRLLIKAGIDFAWFEGEDGSITIRWR